MRSIKIAGTDFMIGSFTFTCIMMAPTIKTATIIADGRIRFGNQKPTRRAMPAPIFKAPTIKKAMEGKPYASNSSLSDLAWPPRYEVADLDRRSHTFKRPTATIS